MEFFQFLFDTAGYPARWHCGHWTPFMGWLHILSDMTIFIAYMGIPVTIIYFKNRFEYLKINYILLLFAAFIFFCGITHLNDAIIFWYPFYNFSGFIKLITAVVSILTLIVLASKMPEIILFLNEKLSSKSLKDIFEASSQGLMIVNKHGKIVFANQVTAKLFDYEQNALIGHVVEDLMPESFREKHVVHRLHYIKKPKKRTMGITQDLYGQSLTGRIFPVETTLSPLKFESEDCVLCSVVDITERKARDDELQLSNQTLEKMVQDLEEFTYVASHDLKEPIRGLHNYSRILLDENEDTLTEDGKKKLRMFLVLTQRMENQIDTLLKYSKLGSERAANTNVEVNDMIQDVKANIGYLLEEKNAKIIIESNMPAVMGEKQRLEEVFLNLIINGIKYNQSTTPTITIGVKDEMNASTVHATFYVKDNGIGIKPEHADKVFTLFKRLHLRETYGGGSGVGLTIVRKIIENHGGKIWMESKPDKGTTFFFTLEKSKVGK